MNDTNQSNSKSKIGVFEIIIIIVLAITFFGLVILYLLYFFRNTGSNQNHTVWNIVDVSPDAAGSGVATITPGINYAYNLVNGVTSVVLNTPTVSNYGGTTFMIKAPNSFASNNTFITPPPGVTMNISSLPPNGGALFVWSNNKTVLTVF